jgi:hypothetical protein
MNYGYECRDWSLAKKQELAKRLKELIGEMKLTLIIFYLIEFLTASEIT